jgi:hypothetical protein
VFKDNHIFKLKKISHLIFIMKTLFETEAFEEITNRIESLDQHTKAT